MAVTDHDAAPVSTGVTGLDHILAGGYASQRSHLIEGRPGSGKTTLAMQFLLDGVRRGERCLYITLSESRRELLNVAERHGWSLDGIEICELVAPELSLDPGQQQSLVHSSDLELGETIRMAIAEIERFKPERVVFDSLSEIRLLSQGSLRYRRQVHALRSFLLIQNTTALLLDDLTAETDDLNLHSLSHAVIRLEQLAPLYGGERRRLRVIKMRGTPFRGGFHDYVIRRGGLTVFPRLVAAEHLGTSSDDQCGTGSPELDKLLGGGLDRGTSTMLIGPSGVGKSTVALTCVTAAIARGERALILSFDETTGVLTRRARGLAMPIDDAIAAGSLIVEQIDPAEVSPGELADIVQNAVEHRDVTSVVIDSLTGYHNAMPEENYLLLQMHELLTYLNQQGVITLLVLAQHGMIGAMGTNVDLTYLSDTILLFRTFEAEGRLRRAISVVKKRTGSHEDAIRELRIDSDGIRVGEPLSAFRGVMTGVPTFEGERSSLLPIRAADDRG
ncbi:circadian clock protein KaiC [Methylobacterium sp. PvP062]|uniref:non-specific serine/threonine protein kinase n=1 Tax=Methylobacterium radiotolerans TaxID=31998 RepID=A0ABV2N8Q7_9HYPH|nr:MULTISPECIES: ATPase domain-containing protein [unclassified Methylobacterium]MBP2493886.1 circadian clock protein KaiC [Methylobacterium sp. PvP105]MBP2499740.1 circadian clock protein KaiC [Methylobacterium sp. PvP109]MCX7335249.1 AAA family ATPase [Hyphomicrobiales bacterium]